MINNVIASNFSMFSPAPPEDKIKISLQDREERPRNVACPEGCLFGNFRPWLI